MKLTLFLAIFCLTTIAYSQTEYSYESTFDKDKKEVATNNHLFAGFETQYIFYPGFGNKFDPDFQTYLPDAIKKPLKGSVANFALGYHLGFVIENIEISAYTMRGYTFFSLPEEVETREFNFHLDANFRGITLAGHLFKKKNPDATQNIVIIGCSYREALYEMSYFSYNEPGLPIIDVHAGWHAFSSKYSFLIPSIGFLTGKRLQFGMDFNFSIPLKQGSWNYENFPKFGFNHVGFGLMKIRYNIL